LAFMIKKGWIAKRKSKVDKVKEALTYFGVSSTTQWKHLLEERSAQFRQSSAFKIDAGAVAAWLRQGEVLASRIQTRPFDRRMFLSVLREVRSLTTEPPEVFESRLPVMCAEAGVAVVFVPSPRGCRASGATQWLSPNKALIQLSLRYRTDDHLWFTFFHEAGHILKHPKKAVFLESDQVSSGVQEEEANRFAIDMLIPPSSYEEFVARSDFSKTAIMAFAAELAIAPGVIVGRLQHEGRLPWNSSCSTLKKRFRWVDA